MPAWPADIPALIPVYNHAATVGGVVAGLIAHGAAVTVVDDGSSDGSGDAAGAAGARVIRLPRNRGKGAAIAAGLAILTAPAVVTVDADGQHAADDALRLAMAAQAEPGAVHIGVREMSGAPWSSRAGRRLSNAAVQLCCRARAGDSQSGLRAYPLPRTRELPASATGYAWEVEVLVRAARAGIAIRQHAVSVAYPEDRISHFASVRDSVRFCLVVARLAVLP